MSSQNLPPKKIIHLSDLHAGAGEEEGKPCGNNRSCKDNLSVIMEDIIRTYGESSREYVIVITGDLVDNAKRDPEYAQAKEELAKLKNAGFDMLIIPGNHDYGSGAKLKRKFVNMFKNAIYNSLTGISHVMNPPTNPELIVYPKLDIIPQPGTPEAANFAPIAFIGLDSNEGELNFFEAWGANGELGDRQRDLLKKMLKSPEVQACPFKVVYLHHHPFEKEKSNVKPWHSLDDATDLVKLLNKLPVDMVLFGHNHGGEDETLQPGTQLPRIRNVKRIYDGGSSTGKRGGHSPLRVIDLSQPKMGDEVVKTF
ncbi:MAG: hypothetical protein G8345_14710 [Magnetococcales bacterium]|nr:hypothetical protein [Magnetococcales bacterium]